MILEDIILNIPEELQRGIETMMQLHKHGFWPRLVSVAGSMRRRLFGMVTVRRNISSAQEVLNGRSEMLRTIHPLTLPLLTPHLKQYEERV